MSILVICQHCGSKFNVSEKFAGRTGPCPKCKGTITIPNPDDVKVHMPDDYAGAKDEKGRPVGKPLSREETKLSAVQWVAALGGTLTVIVVAWLLGSSMDLSEQPLVTGVCLVVVSVPIVWFAYEILRNDDLEAYRGVSLLIRVSICTAVHAGLWGVFYFVPADFVANGWAWLGVAPPFLVAGATASFATFDLDMDNAFFHYAFYILLTMALRWFAGMGWIWEATAG